MTFVNRDHPIESIAVLPFVTQNDDPQADRTAALGDAITDSIINNLSQLPNLDVKPRVAVQRYKDREVDPREVASTLDVHAVLTGRIIRRGDDLQVTIALVDAPDNRNLWGEQYNWKISDLLLIQQEIAGNVSDKLRLKLSGEEKRPRSPAALCERPQRLEQTHRRQHSGGRQILRKGDRDRSEQRGGLRGIG